MSASVELRGVGKRFGTIAAVEEVSLLVQAGEFLTLLGPSGCGKTTLLRVIAGFERPDRGTVWLGGADVTALPPYRRDVNQVFQSYALFPHLSVRENIAFGLRMQKLPSSRMAERVAATVALVALEGCEDRRPHELSGGQRQRVALARALAPQPAVLLLDEPLSALDARLRQAMQLELKRLQRRLGTTFILVTHDQEEALTMSDRIALLNGGCVEQVGTAPEIYRRPATAFAAEFMGHANLVQAELIRHEDGRARVRLSGGLEICLAAGAWVAGRAQALISIRAERIRLSTTPLSEENAFKARIEESLYRGSSERFGLATSTGTRLNAVVPGETARGDSLRTGDRVWAAVSPEDIFVQPA